MFSSEDDLFDENRNRNIFSGTYCIDISAFIIPLLRGGGGFFILKII